MVTAQDKTKRSVVALSGGVGGAKLAFGLARQPSVDLTIIANTADDFTHLGLPICPDLDTVMYTLAGLSNPVQGWGLDGESWGFLDALKALGGPQWFQLGDRDLATHIMRRQGLEQGLSLTEVTARLCGALGVHTPLLPMSDDPVQTRVHTGAGELAFQDYFVRQRCDPEVTGFHFEGVESARPQSLFMELLADPELDTVVICPSNPFVSIDPMLTLPGVREALHNSPAMVVAVSPIIAGTAVKGPAAKMMGELGLEVTANAVAEHYRGLIDGFVVDASDATLASAIETLGMSVAVTETLMKTTEDKDVLAQCVLQYSAHWRQDQDLGSA